MHETTIATNVGMLIEATSWIYDGPTRKQSDVAREEREINEKLINSLNFHK